MSQPSLYKPFANYECKKEGFKKSMVPIITVYQSWAGLKSKLERPIDLPQPRERERESKGKCCTGTRTSLIMQSTNYIMVFATHMNHNSQAHLCNLRTSFS